MAERRATTSIKVNPELWKRAKIHAIEKGIDLSDLLENLLEKELGKQKPSKP